MDWQDAVRVSGPFLFEPSAALSSTRVDGGRIITEYADGTTLEAIPDLACQFTLRCNRMLWVQLTPSGRLIITTANGPDHTFDPAKESTVERSMRFFKRG